MVNFSGSGTFQGIGIGEQLRIAFPTAISKSAMPDVSVMPSDTSVGLAFRSIVTLYVILELLLSLTRAGRFAHCGARFCFMHSLH